MAIGLPRKTSTKTDLPRQEPEERVRNHLRVLLQLAIAIGTREGLLRNEHAIDKDRNVAEEGESHVANKGDF